MSKKPMNEKVITVETEEVVDMNELQNMANEANASAAEEKATAPVASNKDKKEKAKKEAPKVDPVEFASIMAKVPETFTPAFLDKAFGLNDGGKTVRRHLRKYFPDNHEGKDKWAFTKAANKAIIEYFAARYTFNEVK